MLEGVSATALLTLRARAEEHHKTKRLFADPWAAEWIGKVETPDALAKKYTQWIQVKTVVRVDQIDSMIRTIAGDRATTVIELGCGLSTRWQRLGLPGEWIDLDLPEVVAIRESLGATGPGHRHLAMSALDRRWLESLDASAPTIIVAEGLWYYLPKDEVEQLFIALRRKVPGAAMIFDVVGLLDFEASVVHSRKIGAPILWAVDPPFERAMEDLGLATIPGLEPGSVLETSIRRLGPGMRQFFALGAKVKIFRDRRSGTMVGRLKPL